MTAGALAGRGPVVVTLSGVRSVTHLVHASSYLASLVATAGAPVTVDYLGSGLFLGRDAVPPGEVHRWLSVGGQVTVREPTGADRWLGVGGDRHIYLSVGVPGIKPWLRLARAHAPHPPHVVVIDEGIGSYGNWQTRHAAYRRQGGAEPWSTVRAVAVTAAARGLTSERWALYAEDAAGRWQVVPEVAAPFRATPGPAAASTASDSANRAVFLTQPWVELGLVTEAAYGHHLATVAEGCRAVGRELAVRPHPAERAERYAAVPGVEVLPAVGPAELDPAVVGAAVALGADSTALLNVAALHGVRSLRLGMPELDILERGLGPRQRGLLDAFLPAPIRAEAVASALSSG